MEREATYPGMTIQQLLETHRTRCARWHAGSPPWSALEWSACMAGEAGEACNAAKKLKRMTDGMANPDERDASPTAEKYRKNIVKEIADVIHYGVLFADAIGEGEYLEDALRETFNNKSELNGFPERL